MIYLRILIIHIAVTSAAVSPVTPTATPPIPTISVSLSMEPSVEK